MPQVMNPCSATVVYAKVKQRTLRPATDSSGVAQLEALLLCHSEGGELLRTMQ